MNVFDFISSILTPTTNVDGSPMVFNTGLDVHGIPFGVTNDWLMDSTSSMFDNSSSFDFSS